MDDQISKAAVIDALDEICERECEYSKPQRAVMCGACRLGSAFDVVDELPPAERKKGRWIPCEERLPEDERRVLCTVQSGEHYSVVPCIFIQHTRRWLPEVHGNHNNVIAWMPLPEPYKGEEG